MPWGGMRVGGRTPSSSSLPISVVPWHSGSCLTRVRPLTKPLHLLPRLTSLSSRGGWRVRVPPIRQGRRLSSPFPSSVPSAMTHPDLAPPPPPSWDCVAECGGVHASGVTTSWVPRALLGTRVDPPCTCIDDTRVRVFLPGHDTGGQWQAVGLYLAYLLPRRRVVQILGRHCLPCPHLNLCRNSPSNSPRRRRAPVDVKFHG